MDPWLFGILDGALVAIVALGLGAWQYVSVTREIARDKVQKQIDASSPSGGSGAAEERPQS